MRYVSFVMAVIFVAFAALQYNDPDPYVWIPVYGWMAFLSYFYAFHRASPPDGTPHDSRFMRYAPFISMLFFLSWTIISYSQTTGQWWGGEVERETGGLAICAVWAGILWKVRSEK